MKKRKGANGIPTRPFAVPAVDGVFILDPTNTPNAARSRPPIEQRRLYHAILEQAVDTVTKRAGTDRECWDDAEWIEYPNTGRVTLTQVCEVLGFATSSVRRELLRRWDKIKHLIPRPSSSLTYEERRRIKHLRKCRSAMQLAKQFNIPEKAVCAIWLATT